MMHRRRPLSAALPLLLALSVRDDAALAQQPKRQAPPPQPLGDVLHLVLDKDKDGSVTLAELNDQISMLETMFQNGEGEEAEEYKAILAGVRSWAPGMFDLLDSDGSGGLTKAELKFVTRFEKSLRKGGGMRDLVRDTFGILDGDQDDRLSAKELLEGSKCDHAMGAVAAKFHGLFPLRKTPGELVAFVRSTVKSLGGDDLDEEAVGAYIEWIDDDGDGYIQRKEVGKYYNIAGKKFLEISKTIKQMGPMMAMFSGMNNMGGDEF